MVIRGAAAAAMVGTMLVLCVSCGELCVEILAGRRGVEIHPANKINSE